MLGFRLTFDMIAWRASGEYVLDGGFGVVAEADWDLEGVLEELLRRITFDRPMFETKKHCRVWQYCSTDSLD